MVVGACARVCAVLAGEHVTLRGGETKVSMRVYVYVYVYVRACACARAFKCVSPPRAPYSQDPLHSCTRPRHQHLEHTRRCSPPKNTIANDQPQETLIPPILPQSCARLGHLHHHHGRALVAAFGFAGWVAQVLPW